MSLVIILRVMDDAMCCGLDSDDINQTLSIISDNSPASN